MNKLVWLVSEWDDDGDYSFPVAVFSSPKKAKEWVSAFNKIKKLDRDISPVILDAEGPFSSRYEDEDEDTAENHAAPPVPTIKTHPHVVEWMGDTIDRIKNECL